MASKEALRTRAIRIGLAAIAVLGFGCGFLHGISYPVDPTPGQGFGEYTPTPTPTPTPRHILPEGPIRLA